MNNYKLRKFIRSNSIAVSSGPVHWDFRHSIGLSGGAVGLLLSALFVALTSSPAHADEYGPDYESFAEAIQSATRVCGDEGIDCENSGLRTQVLFDSTEGEPIVHPIVSERLPRLKKIAINQAGIWADTILEGEYVSDSETSLDSVEGVYRGERMIGYRITYSEKAWFVGNCTYDYSDQAKLDGCASGRIIESSFVSASLKSWMRDESAFAEFFED